MNMTWAWPGSHEWERTRLAFAAAVADYSATGPGVRQRGAGDSGVAGDEAAAGDARAIDDGRQPYQLLIQPDLELGHVRWGCIVRQGAPDFVRRNGWLTMAWAARCVQQEEPRLVWLGVAALVLMGSSVAYNTVRSLVAALLGE